MTIKARSNLAAWLNMASAENIMASTAVAVADAREKEARPKRALRSIASSWRKYSTLRFAFYRWPKQRQIIAAQEALSAHQSRLKHQHGDIGARGVALYIHFFSGGGVALGPAVETNASNGRREIISNR